jgi:CHASE3 domain sensor protein
MYRIHTQPGNGYDAGDDLYHLTVHKHLDQHPLIQFGEAFGWVGRSRARFIADAGCGYGGFAVLVAHQAPALEVDGYALSDAQPLKKGCILNRGLATEALVGDARFMIPAFIFAGIPLIFIAAIVVFQLAKNVPDARSARANTVLSFETIRAANAIDAAVQDAERGQRGFLITGQEVYLDPYTKAKERLPQLMVELQQATVASADQLPRLLELQADITANMNELATTITATRQQGYEAAKAIVNTDAGRLSMEAISADLQSIRDAASARLNARLQRAAATEERMMLTFVVVSIIAAIALLAGAFLLARAYRRAAISEQVLQATLDSVREGVGALDQRSRLRTWNKSFQCSASPDVISAPELRYPSRKPTRTNSVSGSAKSGRPRRRQTVRCWSNTRSSTQNELSDFSSLCIHLVSKRDRSTRCGPKPLNSSIAAIVLAIQAR